MKETSIQLFCSSEAFCDDLRQALLVRNVRVSNTAEWFVLVDQPIGWALSAHPTLEPTRTIIASDNPCPEYRRDLLELKSAVLSTLVPLDAFVERLHLIWGKETTTSKPVTSLTSVERLTLRLLANEMTNQDIAQVRGVALGTVKNTVRTVFFKLNLRSRSEATHYYFGRWHVLNDWLPPSHVSLSGPHGSRRRP